jgi:hypothetical protein
MTNYAFHEWLDLLLASCPLLPQHDFDPEDGNSTVHSHRWEDLTFNFGGKAKRKDITWKT